MDFRVGRFRLLFVFAVLILSSALPRLFPQAAGGEFSLSGDPAAFIGLGLEDLLRRAGTPRSVYAVRGLEEWQDDVVFVYDEGDFYILKDKVWQLGLKSAYRIACGDPVSAAYLSFGSALYSGPDYVVFPLRGRNWPMALRFNFDPAGKITAIFIYRSDL